LLAVASPVAAGEGDVADRVFEQIRKLRAREKRGELERLAELDALALKRAASIAVLPEDRRLPPPQPLSEVLGLESPFYPRGPVEQIDLIRADTDPAVLASRGWRNHNPSFELIVDPRLDAVGVAVVAADDGTQVVVSIFVKAVRPSTDLADLEQAAVDAVNRIRVQEGLGKLKLDRKLSEVARGHSADMAGRDYMAHESPEGYSPGDRVRAAGIPFTAVAENIAKSTDMDDPVVAIVAGWMNSPGHRRNILEPHFRRTGLGAAIDGRGMIWITQLFLVPGN